MQENTVDGKTRDHFRFGTFRTWSKFTVKKSWTYYCLMIPDSEVQSY